MKKGTRMQPVDSTGLPNYARGNKASLRSCPVCGQEPPQETGGVVWKWLAAHFAGHLGYGWTEKGWAENTCEATLATFNRNRASSTTTRSDER